MLDQARHHAFDEPQGQLLGQRGTETLFGSLKVERLHGQRFETIRQAKDEAIAWLLWYNQQRMHSTLNYVSPVEFETEWENTRFAELPHDECGNRSRRWKCRSMESVENDETVSHPSHRPWKSIKPISTFPPPRRLRRDELISSNQPT